jgi:hypothetical protein
MLCCLQDTPKWMYNSFVLVQIEIELLTAQLKYDMTF